MSDTSITDAVTGKERKTRIALDFDGVLHAYTSGWTGPVPLDPPVPGAQEFCQRLLDKNYEIVIFTTRAHPELGLINKFVEIVDHKEITELVKFPNGHQKWEKTGRYEWISRENKGLTLGEEGIRQWLSHHKFPEVMWTATITHKKAHADLMVDDRGFRFEGNFADVDAFLDDNPNAHTWTKSQ